MSEIKISTGLVRQLKDVLKLIEHLNNQSKILSSQDVQEEITDLEQYLKTIPNIHVIKTDHTLTKQELFDLYHYISIQDANMYEVNRLILSYINELQPTITIVKKTIPFSLLYTRRIHFGNNYILDTTAHYIVLNFYSEIVLLDKKKFTVLKEMELEFMFHRYYIDYARDLLLLYYYGHIQFLLFINLKTEEKKVIPLRMLAHDKLSQIFIWRGNSCVIATENQHYIKVNIKQATAETVSLLPQSNGAYRDPFFDVEKQDNKKTDSAYHGISIIMTPQEIQISNAEKVLVILQPNLPYEFTQARFIDERMTRFAVVIRSSLDAYRDRLMIYKLALR